MEIIVKEEFDRVIKYIPDQERFGMSFGLFKLHVPNDNPKHWNLFDHRM
jgi:hypothetical protein